LIDAGEAVSAAVTVEQSVMTALFDVVGDKEVGWTAYDWEALPFGSTRPEIGHIDASGPPSNARLRAAISELVRPLQ